MEVVSGSFLCARDSDEPLFYRLRCIFGYCTLARLILSSVLSVKSARTEFVATLVEISGNAYIWYTMHDRPV